MARTRSLTACCCSSCTFGSARCWRRSKIYQKQSAPWLAKNPQNDSSAQITGASPTSPSSADNGEDIAAAAMARDRGQAFSDNDAFFAGSCEREMPAARDHRPSWPAGLRQRSSLCATFSSPRGATAFPTVELHLSWSLEHTCQIYAAFLVF